MGAALIIKGPSGSIDSIAASNLDFWPYLALLFQSLAAVPFVGAEDIYYRKYECT
jgi:hypothetical protein